MLSETHRATGLGSWILLTLLALLPGWTAFASEGSPEVAQVSQRSAVAPDEESGWLRQHWIAIRYDRRGLGEALGPAYYFGGEDLETNGRKHLGQVGLQLLFYRGAGVENGTTPFQLMATGRRIEGGNFWLAGLEYGFGWAHGPGRGFAVASIAGYPLFDMLGASYQLPLFTDRPSWLPGLQISFRYQLPLNHRGSL